MKSHSSMGSYYNLPPGLEEHSSEAKELLAGEEKFMVQEYEVYRLHLK
jgi:hypothetical protein